MIEGKRGASIESSVSDAWPWKYELMSSEKVTKLIQEQDSHYLLLIPMVSDIAAKIEVYDLASMRSIIAIEGSAGLKKYWVRNKEIQKLVDKINGDNTNRR
ncbi:hypothetical protein A4H97_24160 [Niastella yeongjuensis]|uniref:Uncharacterized protein n=1 Tax=Niastella yeongjuensis TaxID=354355 RepID=A0A1V9F349_9BACT|nr:hypothetical protein [Niastella yeongjuensis]OQP52798.1 hypothetical protein A4H97_24160 [Niastella yeongjuensis]SEP20017.1 hypothetical protein SAMN05660816_04720 [Niastella yeongjuensis]